MSEEKLIRGIGRWDLVAVVINSVIGAGIFGLPSAVAKLIGTYSIIAFAVCSLLIVLFALCFAEVSSRFRSTGGGYLYARRAFGAFVGFEAGWLFWISRLTAFAANCNLMIGYLGYFYEPISTGPARVLVIGIVILALTYINIAGVRDSVKLTNVLTVGKLSPLILFMFIGFFFIEPANFSLGAFPEADVFGKAVVVLIYAFVGFEVAVIPAGEVKDPRRNVPFSLMTAVGIIVAIYIIVQIVAIGTLPDLANSSRPLADAALRFVGPWGAGVVVFGAVVSILGNLNVIVLSSSRLLYAMSEHSDIPRFLSATHAVHRTPYAALGFSATLIFLLTVFSTFITALTISTVSRLCVYLLTFAALPVFRKKPELADTDGFEIPGGNAVAVLSILLGLGLFYFVNTSELVQVTAAGVVGAVFYFSYRAARRKSSKT